MIRSAEFIVKVSIVTCAAICFVLMIVWDVFGDDPYILHLSSTVYGGFFILYMTFFIGIILDRRIDPDLNSIWALYGVACFCGCGFLSVIKAIMENFRVIPTVAAGVFSFIVAILLIADIFINQYDEV